MLKFAFLINADGYEKYTYDAARFAGASVPSFKRWKKLYEIHNAEPLNRYFELPFKKLWFHSVVDESKFNKDDEIFFILFESFHMSYSLKFITYYRKKYKKAKFIYVFMNPVNDYNLKRVKKIEKLLNLICVFDRDDAEKYGYVYMPTIPFELPERDTREIRSDVFFVGLDKGRLHLLLDIYQKLSSQGMICDFWISGVPEEKQKFADKIHYNQKLTYDEVLTHDAQCRCILEVLQDGKTYCSLRTREAMKYHKKLLTTNLSIKDNSFYNADIIQMIKKTDEIDVPFIRKPVKVEMYELANPVSFEAFEKSVISAMSETTI